MGGILVAILVNWVRYLNGPLKWVRFGCNIGELGREIMWPTKMGVILGAILVNWVGYLSVKWVRFCVQQG
jgi:hypothetical protein